VELPEGDVRRQHWWSSRVTLTKAAALLDAATGRDVPRLEAQRAGKAGGWLSPPRWRARAFASAGNGRRPADIMLKAWDGIRDPAVDLTIVHPNPVTGRPLRGSAATFLKDKGKQKCRESADSCGRIGFDFSPMVFDTWGGLHGAGKGVVKAMFTRYIAPFLPSARVAAVGALWR